VVGDGKDNDCDGIVDGFMLLEKSYQWDGNGNLLKKVEATGTTDYSWDARDRLVSTTGSPAYGYDSANLRTTMGGQKMLLDGIEEAREYGPSVVRYEHDPSTVDGLLAQKTSAGKGYFVTDALGSVYAVVDASGAVVSKYGYDVYGARTATTEGVATSWGFTGRRHDGDGQTYHRERYYVPATAEWISPDPLQRPGGLPYAYAAQIPTTAIDPLGTYDIFCSADKQALITAELLQGLNDGWSEIKEYAFSYFNFSGKADFSRIPIQPKFFNFRERLAGPAYMGDNYWVCSCAPHPKGGDNVLASTNLSPLEPLRASTLAVTLYPSFFRLSQTEQTATLVHEQVHVRLWDDVDTNYQVYIQTAELFGLIQNVRGPDQLTEMAAYIADNIIGGRGRWPGMSSTYFLR
jgi:RHS repeat-associated protein